MLRRLSSLALCLFLVAGPAHADDLLWRGDFETGDLSQWSYLVNPQGLSVQSDCVYQGDWAGQVILSGEQSFLWNDRADLNRSEFKYQPPAETTAEGQDTYFGWSFLVPETLSESRHELGYWESDQSWQQMFRFNIVGTGFSFQASAEPEPFWEQPGFAAPGRWRDLAMHIHWSTDPDAGFVDIWLDGEHRGRQQMQTLAAGSNPMFVQIGILRHRRPEVERLLVDNARMGNSMAAVLAAFDPDRPVTCP